jgi:hypothetical protein
MLNSIQLVSVSIVQIPSASNNFLAVCIVTLKTATGSYSSIGEAQGTSESEIKGLLQQAQDDGFNKAMLMAEAYSVKVYQPEPFQNMAQQKPPVSTYGSNNGNGRDNPATEPQKKLLNDLAGQLNDSIDGIILEIYDTTIDKLTIGQADVLIKELKSRLEIKRNLK